MTAKRDQSQNRTAETDKNSNQDCSNWQVDTLFWGLLFIMVGGLVLLHNLGIVNVDLAEALRLWPLAIVVVGVSLLNFKGVWWKIVSALLMLASLGLVAWVMIGGVPSTSNSESNSRIQTADIADHNDAVEELELLIEAGAVALDVSDHTGSDQIITAKLSNEMMNLKSNSELVDGVLKADLKAEGIGWIGRSVGGDFDVSIRRSIPVNLKIDSGASSIKADLSQLDLRGFELDSGASSAEIRLGTIATMSRLRLEAGASSIRISIPEEVGIKVVYDGGLASKDFDESLKEVGENAFETEGYSTTAKKVEIVADIGAASLEIQRY